MIAWSMVAAVLGLLISWGGTIYWSRRGWREGPHGYWFLGLGALAPAWLVAFVGLLGGSPRAGPDAGPPVTFILSSSAALLGIILADALVRCLRDSGRAHRALTYWLVGVLALLPAWGVALLGLIWTRP